MDELETKIESVLFWKGEPMSRKKLATILKVSENEINDAVEKLKNNLAHRGIVLQEKENEINLGTAPQISNLIEELRKEELNKELSKATLETLSIVLYKNGATRAEIDYIRGVNSSFTLRALSVRGLVEKTVSETDNRRYIYKPTFELLSFMGVAKIEDLPDYEQVNNSIHNAVKEEDVVAEELPIQNLEDETTFEN